VPNFAAIAAPLTDVMKRGSPENLIWTDVQEQAFQTLKCHVCAKPVLCLPDINKNSSDEIANVYARKIL